MFMTRLISKKNLDMQKEVLIALAFEIIVDTSRTMDETKLKLTNVHMTLVAKMHFNK